MIVAFRVDGWSGRVAETRIDERVRYPDEIDYRVFGVDTPEEVVRVLAQRLDRYSGQHQGVRRRFCQSRANIW